MGMRKWLLLGLLLWLVLVGGLVACGGPASTASGAADEVTLTLGGYTTPREAYGEIIPLFQAFWKEKSGQSVRFEESYLGSGAQSRAVVEGFEADLVALSLEADVKRIADAGLITHDWKALPHGGMVSTSVVVIAVREGNPKGIREWADLAQPGLEVLTPDPQTSGGAQWNVLAMLGAAERGTVPGYAEGDRTAAFEFLRTVFSNVTVLDKSARDSITTFEKGIGDVAITYENEALVGQQNGQNYEYVVPRSTILIENPDSSGGSLRGRAWHPRGGRGVPRFSLDAGGAAHLCGAWVALGRPRGGAGKRGTLPARRGSVHCRAFRRLEQRHRPLLWGGRALHPDDRGGAA